MLSPTRSWTYVGAWTEDVMIDFQIPRVEVDGSDLADQSVEAVESDIQNSNNEIGIRNLYFIEGVRFRLVKPHVGEPRQ